MPIRIRLGLAFAFAAAAIFGVSAFLFESSFRHGLEEGLDPGLRTQANAIARALPPSGEGVGLQDQTAPAAIATRDVVAQVLDRDGAVIDTTREAGSSPVITSDVVRRARHDDVFTEVAIDREGEPHRVLARSVSTGAGLRIVVVGASLEPAQNAIGRVHDALIFGGLAVVVVAGVGAWLLAGAALRPVERMRRKAADISEHDPASRLPVPATHDEIAALGTTMNDVLARLQHALQLQRDFVADAGHELRTPLAVLQAELELATRRARTQDELVATVTAAKAETQRLARLTEALLFLARADDEREAMPREVVDLGPIVERAVTGLQSEADRRGVAIDVDANGHLAASVNSDLIRRAVENLIENALRHAPSGTTVGVSARRDDGDAVIEVVDDGPGFPPEFLPHAFERFRRADEARSSESGGTGLGLAIVQAIAEAHGGSARARNRAAGGASVELAVPAER